MSVWHSAHLLAPAIPFTESQPRKQTVYPKRLPTPKTVRFGTFGLVDMRTNPHLCLLWLICLTGATSHYNHEIEELSPRKLPTLPKRQDVRSTHFPVTGVQNSGTPARLEIRQLQQRADLFNIFLLGLARFHATPQDDKLSYYQIRGLFDQCSEHWLVPLS